MAGEPAAAAVGGTPISGCVICFQEADRIADCLRSLAFCDEVVVVDSGSTDGTAELAAGLGARVIRNAPFPGYREQKHFAVQQARHDYVFCLDADERATPALQQKLLALARAGLTAAAYEMPRHNHYLGAVLKRGLSWPDRKVRLFDRRAAQWGGRTLHERVELQPGAEVVPLAEGIEHLSYRNFRHHLRTIDSFTALAAATLWAEGRRTNPFDLLVRPVAVFVKSLVLKLGFVDGWRGVLVAAMAAYTDWKKYWRLLWQGRARGGP